MIRVRIHINDRAVIDIHAVSVMEFNGKNAHHNYKLFVTDADNKEHEYSDGGAKLAAKMLYQYDKWIKVKGKLRQISSNP